MFEKMIYSIGDNGEGRGHIEITFYKNWSDYKYTIKMVKTHLWCKSGLIGLARIVKQYFPPPPPPSPNPAGELARHTLYPPWKKASISLAML